MKKEKRESECPSVLVDEHMEQIQQTMKQASFWKYAAFGIVCIRQEFEIYKSLAAGRRFDMSRFLEKHWKASGERQLPDIPWMSSICWQ